MSGPAVGLFERWRRARQRRRELTEERVLLFLRCVPDVGGWKISQYTGLRSRAVYAVLARLKKARQVTARWIDEPYPQRRVYRLSPTGEGRAKDVADSLTTEATTPRQPLPG